MAQLQLQATATLPGSEMAQLQLQATATLRRREMAQLPAAGVLRRAAVDEKATVRRLVAVEVRATVGPQAFVPAATVGPLAAVWWTGPAASQTAVSLQQALGRAAGLLVWALSGLPLAAAGLVGWAWLGR
jgi:carbonic anhydrase/acetyltransferase-like protein (isoleucine patch superfamily)